MHKRSRMQTASQESLPVQTGTLMQSQQPTRIFAHAGAPFVLPVLYSDGWAGMRSAWRVITGGPVEPFLSPTPPEKMGSTMKQDTITEWQGWGKRAHRQSCTRIHTKISRFRHKPCLCLCLSPTQSHAQRETNMNAQSIPMCQTVVEESIQ